MPDKLQQLLTNRPVKVSGEVQYPTEQAPKGPIKRFMGTAMGIDDQEPGDAPSALGEIAAMLGPGIVSRMLGKAKGLPTAIEAAEKTFTGPPTRPELGVFKKLPKWAEEQLLSIQDKEPAIARTPSSTHRQWVGGGDFNSYDQPTLGEDFIKTANTTHIADTRNTENLEKALLGRRPNYYHGGDAFSLQYAKQPKLPTDIPMISYHPDVPVSEVESGAKYLHKLAADYADAGGQKALENLKEVNFKPEAGGAYHRSDKVMTIGTKQTPQSGLNTTKVIAHEFKHAMDHETNPEVFKDYPNTMFSAFSVPTNYFNHPSEIRARAMGELENFLLESELAKQGTLPKGELGALAEKIEALNGNRLNDLVVLDKSIKPRPYTPPTSNPYQQKLPAAYSLDPELSKTTKSPNLTQQESLPGLGKLGEDEKLAQSLFNRTVEKGLTYPKNRLQRMSDLNEVNTAYNALADRGLAATEPELNKLRGALSELKAQGGLTPAPTGLDVGKHHVNIVNKLANSGYEVTPDESMKLAYLLRRTGMDYNSRGRTPEGTGEYVRKIAWALDKGDPLKKALKSITGWADNKTFAPRQQWNKPPIGGK